MPLEASDNTSNYNPVLAWLPLFRVSMSSWRGVSITRSKSCQSTNLRRTWLVDSQSCEAPKVDPLSTSKTVATNLLGVNRVALFTVGYSLEVDTFMSSSYSRYTPTYPGKMTEQWQAVTTPCPPFSSKNSCGVGKPKSSGMMLWVVPVVNVYFWGPNNDGNLGKIAK
jgi:hypothetical protein